MKLFISRHEVWWVLFLTDTIDVMNIFNEIMAFIKEYGGLGWIVAAVVLLFNIYKHIDNKRAGKVSVKVDFSNGGLTYPDGSISDMMIFLKISNTGNKPIILSSATVNIKHKIGGSIINGYGSMNPMPYKLDPGHDYQVWYEARPIARSLKHNGVSGKVALGGIFGTQANGSFKSKKDYVLDVDDWSK